jgi:hypothetical protein
MNLADSINRLAARLTDQLAMLTTEEATKNALVMPFINALGFNVFDPTEVVPEFTADVGIKKGEKVDYAIFVDGKPMLLIECKTAGASLDLKHASQLYRYFSTTDARFAVLTNGVDYWFYTDVDSPNKMDDKPFFEFSLSGASERSVGELEKFTKARFDVDNILSDASELKYLKQLKRVLADEHDEPSEDFVRLMTSRVYDGQFRGSAKEQFTDLVGRAFRDFVRERVNARLTKALEGNAAPDLPEDEPEAPIEADDNGIDTTPEELEAFHIVRAILSQHVDPSRVVMRDTKSYCGVLLDDNNRKPICRLRFNHRQKYVSFIESDRSERREPIESIAELYRYAETFVSKLALYEKNVTPELLEKTALSRIDEPSSGEIRPPVQ